MAVPVLAAMAIIGATIQVVGQMNAAQAEAEAQQRNAYLKRKQANELLARQAINEQTMRDQELEGEDRFMGQSASGTEGNWLGGVMKMRRDLAHNISISHREADFKAGLIREGADVDAQLASDRQTAGYLTGAGTIISGAANAYNTIEKPSSTATSLPKLES